MTVLEKTHPPKPIENMQDVLINPHKKVTSFVTKTEALIMC